MRCHHHGNCCRGRQRRYGVNVVCAAGLQHGAYIDQMGQSRICKPLGRRSILRLLPSHLVLVAVTATPHNSPSRTGLCKKTRATIFHTVLQRHVQRVAGSSMTALLQIYCPVVRRKILKITRRVAKLRRIVLLPFLTHSSQWPEFFTSTCLLS